MVIAANLILFSDSLGIHAASNSFFVFIANRTPHRYYFVMLFAESVSSDNRLRARPCSVGIRRWGLLVHCEI